MLLIVAGLLKGLLAIPLAKILCEIPPAIIQEHIFPSAILITIANRLTRIVLPPDFKLILVAKSEMLRIF
jgi:hypothetical protein